MDGRYSVYRQIRAQRTWRPLGRMSWWRVIVGVALLILVLLMSGLPAQRMAAYGRFEAAERLLLFPTWMEKYKPDSSAFIKAGALAERGEREAALALLRSVNPSELSEGEALEYLVLMDTLNSEAHA